MENSKLTEYKLELEGTKQKLKDMMFDVFTYNPEINRLTKQIVFLEQKIDTMEGESNEKGEDSKK